MKTAMAYGLDEDGGRALLARAVPLRGGAVRSELVHDSAASEGLREGALKSFLGRGEVELAAALGVRQSVCRWIEVPLSSPRKARRVLDSQLDLALPFPVEQAVRCYPRIERYGTTSVRALAVAAKASAVDERIVQLDRLTGGAHHLDHEGLAVWDRAARVHPAGPDAWRIVAYVARDRSFIVQGRGLWPQSVHSAPEPGDQAQWGFRVRSALASLRSRAGDGPLPWLWVGPAASDAQMLNGLQAELGEDPAVAYAVADHSESFLAQALAERCLLGPRATLACDLRVDARRHPGVGERQRARLRRAAALWMGCGAALVALSVAFSVAMDRREVRIESSLKALAMELAGPGVSVPRGQEALMVERAMAELEQASAPLRRAFEARESRLLTELLDLLVMGQMDIQSFSLRDGALSISGTAPDWDHCGIIQEWLAGRGFLTELDREEAGGDERVHFRLRGGTRE